MRGEAGWWIADRSCFEVGVTGGKEGFEEGYCWPWRESKSDQMHGSSCVAMRKVVSDE